MLLAGPCLLSACSTGSMQPGSLEHSSRDEEPQHAGMKSTNTITHGVVLSSQGYDCAGGILICIYSPETVCL